MSQLSASLSSFITHTSQYYFDITKLENSDFIEEIRENYKAFYPLYSFLLEVTEKYIALNGGN